MANTPRAYRSLTLTNLRMLIRNPAGSSSLFIALIALLVVMKVVTSGEGPHTKVDVVKLSSSAVASSVLASLTAVPTFDMTITSEADASTALRAGKTDMAIVIPSTFGDLDASGRLAPAQLQVEYRTGTGGESSLPIVKGIADTLNGQLLHETPLITLAASSLNARTYGLIDYFLPGVIAFNIIGSALMVAAGTFSNYKSTGVLRRLKATGIKPTVFVLSHASASFLFGMAQTLAIIGAAIVLFSFHLDLPTLLLVTALGYVVFLALGFVIAGWIRDGQRAAGVAQSVGMPLIFIALLSASLPASFAAITKYLPVSYITDAMRQLGEGATISGVSADLAWLTGWALVLLVAAGRVFRWD